MRLSLYRQHVEKWSACTGCDLSEHRSQVVLVKGCLPTDVLFIGEAPGFSEDTIGRPFEGPAGALLHGIIEQATFDMMIDAGAITDTDVSDGEPPRFAFSNLCCCLPTDEEGTKAGEPLPHQIMACSDRLRELVAMAMPRLIIAVGSLPEKWLPKLLPDYKGKFAHVMHPSAILRHPKIQQTNDIKRCIVNIRSAMRREFG